MLCTAASLLVAASAVQHVQAAAVVARQQTSRVANLVVFGDSYSDNCNALRVSSPANFSEAYPFPNCPPAPAGRWSGGEAWPEIIANGTGVKVQNYAVAGATCSNSLFNRTILPAVDQQIQQFASRNGSSQDFSNTVAAVFIGTNDVSFFVNEFQYNPPTSILAPGRSIEDAAQCVADRVQQLYEVGFRRIVVLNNIPLDRAPYFSENSIAGYGQHVTQNGSIVSAYVGQLVNANNALQAQYIEDVSRNLTRADVTIFDTYTLYENLFDNPKQYLGASAKNTTEWCNVCPEVQLQNCTVCPDLENHIWWDPLHPSQATDQYLADAFSACLGVPYTNPL